MCTTIEGVGLVVNVAARGEVNSSSSPAPLSSWWWQTWAVAITYAGHTVGYTETESGWRYRVLCSCGLGHPRFKGDTPPTRATENVAVIDCFRHLRKVRDELRRTQRLTGHGGSVMPTAQGSTLRIGT